MTPKDYEEPVSELSYVPHFEDIAIQYQPGTTREVVLHDGSPSSPDGSSITTTIRPTSAGTATARGVRPPAATSAALLYTPNAISASLLNLVDEPLSELPTDRARPPTRGALDAIMDAQR